MSEIKIVNVSNLNGVWADWLQLPSGALDESEELANVVKVALLTDGLAAVDDILPDPDSSDRRGWWGDVDAETIWDGWPIGSKLWLLSRAKIAPAEAREGSTLVRVEQYCVMALQPLVDKRICSDFSVTAMRNGIEQIDALITVYRGPLFRIDLRFQNLWAQITGMPGR